MSSSWARPRASSSSSQRGGGGGSGVRRSRGSQRGGGGGGGVMDSRSDRADRMFELEEENKRLKAINKRIEQKHHKYASLPARQCTLR